MSERLVFRNVRIFDGAGKAPFDGEVGIEGERIARVTKGRRAQAGAARIVDGRGATLMPGLCDAHTHFSWNDQPSLAAIVAASASGL